MENIYQSLITAIITPFRNNELDFTALKKIVNYQIENGIKAIVAAGSTGEGNNLSSAEYKELLTKATIYAAGQIKIIAGCCSTSTAGALELARLAEEAGVDGIMVTVPPYVKPTQAGIFAHIKAVHDTTNLPIMIYATLARTASNITDETIYNLSKLPRIIALKYSGDHLERISNLRSILSDDFNLLTGDDHIALGFNAQGGQGCVSVAGNITPQLCADMQEKWANGKAKEALDIHLRLLPLYKALFNESNPVPVKYAAKVIGLCENELRVPLLKAEHETMSLIDKALDRLDMDR